MKSKTVFFHVSFSASDLLDSETRFDDITGELINIGIEFDNWFHDEVIGCVGCTFITEKLYYMFKDFGEHLTGINFAKPIRFNKGYNAMENYPDANIPCFYYMNMTGKLLVDDFSIFRLNGSYNCVLSDTAVKFLLNNGVYSAFGEMINNEIHEYFEIYYQKIKKNNYSEVMPRLFLKDFI